MQRDFFKEINERKFLESRGINPDEYELISVSNVSGEKRVDELSQDEFMQLMKNGSGNALQNEMREHEKHQEDIKDVEDFLEELRR